MSMPKIEKPIETVTLSYAEYVGADTFPSKYFIVNALQQYVFIVTRNRAKAEQYRKEHYPMYGLRCTVQEKGGGSSCSDTSSTRRGQAKYLNKSFGLPRGL